MRVQNLTIFHCTECDSTATVERDNQPAHLHLRGWVAVQAVSIEPPELLCPKCASMLPPRLVEQLEKSIQAHEKQCSGQQLTSPFPFLRFAGGGSS